MKLFLWFIFFFVPLQARPISFKEGTILIDAEMQDLFDRLLWQVQKADKKKLPSYNVVLVCDLEFNAFTNGDENIFVCQGVLTHLHTIGQLAAILFHEIGHIQGRHGLHQILDQRHRKPYTLIPMILGAIASWKTGRVEPCVMGGMAHDVENLSTLKTSRVYENCADLFALGLFKDLGWNAKSMLDVFEILSEKNQTDFPVYLSSHPLVQERFDLIKQKISTSREMFVKENDLEKDLDHAFQRIKLKNMIFSVPVGIVMQNLKKVQDRPLQTYGWALLAQRQNEPLKSLAYLDHLEKYWKNDPFIFQLRAELYYTLGRFSAAYSAIQKAMHLKPKNPILFLDCAYILLAQKRFSEIITLLEPIVFFKSFFNQTMALSFSFWQILARAYGVMGQKGCALSCQVELALLDQKWDRALAFSKKALPLLSSSHPFYNRMITVKEAIKWEKTN